MPEPFVLVTLAGCMLLGAVVRGIVGFGDALVAMPLMALVVPLPFATPLMSLCSVVGGLVLLFFDWQHVDPRQAWRLVVGALVGLPVGILCLANVPVWAGRICLGAFLLLFVLYESRSVLPAEWRRFAPLPYVFGFLAGLFGGFFTTPGPPIVAYGRLQDWPAERFRAAMTGFAIPFGWVTCLGHGLAGFWTPGVFAAFGCAVPALAVGLVVGNVVHGRVPREAFTRVIRLALLTLGILLIVQGAAATA